MRVLRTSRWQWCGCSQRECSDTQILQLCQKSFESVAGSVHCTHTSAQVVLLLYTTEPLLLREAECVVHMTATHRLLQLGARYLREAQLVARLGNATLAKPQLHHLTQQSREQSEVTLGHYSPVWAIKVKTLSSLSAAVCNYTKLLVLLTPALHGRTLRTPEGRAKRGVHCPRTTTLDPVIALSVLSSRAVFQIGSGECAGFGRPRRTTQNT